MSQFLLSYWWLILVAAVVVVLVTKSIVKVVVSTVVILVVLSLFWQTFVASGFSKMDLCFTEEAKNSEILNAKLQTMEDEVAQNQLFCSQDTASFTRLTDCLNEVRRINSFSFSVYANLPKFKDAIDKTVTSHNSTCPDSLLEKPTFRDEL